MDSKDEERKIHSGESENDSFAKDSNIVLIKELEQSSDSSNYSDDAADSVSEMSAIKEKKNPNEIASINAHIQKLVRYLKVSIPERYRKIFTYGK